MKKLITLMLALVLAVAAFGCNQPAGDDKGGDSEVYNVVNLVNGNLGDKSFFDSAEAGLKKLADAGRITYKTIEMGGTDADQPAWKTTLDDVSATGDYDLIICGTYQMPEYLNEIAAKYPDQKYLIYDSESNQPNVVNINYKQNDMGYLVGVFAAAMTTETSVDKINEQAAVGFIGGVDSPVINDFLVGFIEGAKATNADIKVDVRYVNSYVDTATAKELALGMINDNACDIIWGVAGLSGNGGADAALETGKAWFIGVDSDQELTLDAAAAAITLTSGLKNIGDSLIWFFDEWDAGNGHFGENLLLGINENGVGVVTDKNFKNIAPQAVQDKVTAAIAAVSGGTIKVGTAIGDAAVDVKALVESVHP